MYEKFTDRARKLMQLANQKAQQLNHEYVGTEHLLYGLIRLGDGTAWKVLEHLGISPHEVHTELNKLIEPGPEMTTMGKLPQTPRTKKIMEYAIEQARLLHHNYVGTEHILLGMVREGHEVAGSVLKNMGIASLDMVRGAVREMLRMGQGTSPTYSFTILEDTDTPVVVGDKYPIDEKKFAESQRAIDEGRVWTTDELKEVVRADRQALCNKLEDIQKRIENIPRILGAVTSSRDAAIDILAEALAATIQILRDHVDLQPKGSV